LWIDLPEVLTVVNEHVDPDGNVNALLGNAIKLTGLVGALLKASVTLYNGAFDEPDIGIYNVDGLDVMVPSASTVTATDGIATPFHLGSDDVVLANVIAVAPIVVPPNTVAVTL
jgi:hypothetical protein